MKRISFLKADRQDTAKRSLLRAGLWGMTCYLLEFIWLTLRRGLRTIRNLNPTSGDSLMNDFASGFLYVQTNKVMSATLCSSEGALAKVRRNGRPALRTCPGRPSSKEVCPFNADVIELDNKTNKS